MFYFLFKRKSKDKTLRVILFYVIYCILNEAVSFYLQSIQSPVFVFLIYSFTIVEYTFFCTFIWFTLAGRNARKWIPVVWLAFILFALVDIIFINKSGAFDSFTSGIESLVVFFLCILYLFAEMGKSNNLIIYSTFDFWIVITFLIYFSGTFFLYIFVASVGGNPDFQKQYFVINISFNILKNVLLCVAMTMRINKSADRQKSGIPDLDDDLIIHNKINFLH